MPLTPEYLADQQGRNELTQAIQRATQAVYDCMDAEGDMDWTTAQRHAVAAIEAMREPTAAMVEAVHRIQNGSDDPAEDWREMIDATLKEGLHSPEGRSQRNGMMDLNAIHRDCSFVLSRGWQLDNGEYRPIWTAALNNRETGRSVAITYGHPTAEEAVKALPR